jgi:Protein of unknown function (DUF2946)
MLSRHRQKIGALLGMFAILLSVIAPTISQVLRSGQTDTEHHSHHHPHHAHLEAPLHLAHADSAAHHHSPDSSLVRDACPYCGLITHAPALPGAPVMFAVAIQQAEFALPIPTAAFRPYTAITSAQPRAPPGLS